MTCIIGLVEDNKVYMASESIGTNGFTQTAVKNKKIFIKESNSGFNKLLLGGCGSFKILQYLEEFTLPDKNIKEDDFVYVKRVTKALVDVLLKDSFCLEENSRKEKILASEILVGYDGSLYKIQSDTSILESAKSYVATGSGEYHAMASLYSTEHTSLSAEERLKLAIECANEFVVTVDNNLQLVCVDYSDEEHKEVTEDEKVLAKDTSIVSINDKENPNERQRK